jgi:hypothetical protein
VKAITRAAGALLSLACLATLSACGDDVTTSAEPVEVEVGKAFSWNGFAVEDGWELNGIKRSVDMEEVTTPEVKGTITNKVEESRAAIFEMVFSQDSEPVATLSCSAGTMEEGQSMQFICPGLSAEMPAEYDAVVVQEFDRDSTPS